MASTERLSQFKNKGKDIEDGRRRRKEDALELRKARKDEQLNKRRNIELDLSAGELSDDLTSPQKPTHVRLPPGSGVHDVITGLQSTIYEELFAATQMSRRILSKEKNPPIDNFIEAGLVPRFVDLLRHDEKTDLQFEAAWALTNIASGSAEQTKCVVDHGACPHFIRLLASPSKNVAEQAIWALANIAGDGPLYRDMLLQQGIITPLINLAQSDSSSSFLANVAWCISNLCRYKNPSPPVEAMKMLLPSVKTLVMNPSNGVAQDACWSLYYISDGSNERIQIICDLMVLERLVQIASTSNDKNLVMPALRTLGNIVTGTDEQTQLVIDNGALGAFRKLLIHDTMNIKKECCWIVSNITAGNKNQIEAVIVSGLIEPLIDILATGDSKSQKEAAWAVANLTSGGSLQQKAFLVQAGVLKPLTDMLLCNDAKIIGVVLDAFKNILRAADDLGHRESLCDSLEEFNFLDCLEKLQEHQNEDIYQMAVEIIETYWGAEDDADANINPDDNGQTFKFDADSAPKSDFTF